MECTNAMCPCHSHRYCHCVCPQSRRAHVPEGIPEGSGVLKRRSTGFSQCGAVEVNAEAGGSEGGASPSSSQVFHKQP